MSTVKVEKPALYSGTYNLSAYGDGYGRSFSATTVAGSDTFEATVDGSMPFNAATLINGAPPFPRDVHVISVDDVATGYVPPVVTWTSVGSAEPIQRFYGEGYPTDVEGAGPGDVYIDSTTNQVYKLS